MSSVDNHGLPKSHETSFPNEDDIPRYDRGTRDHASLPPPPPIILPNPQVQRLEKFKLTQALLASKHEDGKPVCGHILKMKSHIDRLRILGVEISGELVVDWVLQSLPESYSEFVREYYMMDHDVTLIDLTYLLIGAESAMIWRAGQANFSGESNYQTSIDIENDDIGDPQKVNSEIVPCVIPKESICFYCQEKGHWRRSCPIYLRDLRDGRVKTYGSTSDRRKERKLKGRSELNLIVKKWISIALLED
ncbi:hypothetical protein Lser_V15G05108 [Lactuca serriola]